MDEHSPQQPVLSVFLASSIHDMKNSVNMLTGSLEEILQELTPESFQAYPRIAHMLFEVKRVNSNLTQLLTLYKVNDQMYPFSPHTCSIEQFALEVLSQNSALLSSKGVSIDVDHPDDLAWHFDEDLISGVINHALNNAIRYSRGRIRLAFAERDGWLEIRVEDDGDGFPLVMLNEPDHMNGVNFATGSTGLGLYFSKEVVKMHKHRGRHGTIHLENGGAWGGGCVILRLP